MHNTYAIDFFTVTTITLRILYVFVVISHERREIKHIAVTAHPTAAWTIQRLRQATPYGRQPEYPIHDDDPVFRSADVQQFLTDADIGSVRTGYRQPQQNGVCEPLIGILLHELLDHIVPLDERHLHKLLRDYIDKYYHPVWIHSGLGHKPPIVVDIAGESQSISGARFRSRSILGGLYYTYEREAA